jgi:FkbM family methyltransferase
MLVRESKVRNAIKYLAHKFGFELIRKRRIRTPSIAVIHAPGMDYPFWIANDVGALWYGAQDYSSNSEMRLLRDLIGEGARVLEIGCHHGFHSVFIAKLVGSTGLLIAMEAEPGNALIAQAQMALNHLDHCIIESAAVGEKPGRACISLVDNVIDGAGLAEERIDVPMVAADAIDLIHGPFSVVKIDVEGFEAKVFRGAAAIMNRRPRLALELHFRLLIHAGDQLQDIIAILISLRYQGTILLPHGECIPYEPERLGELGKAHEKINLFLIPM